MKRVFLILPLLIVLPVALSAQKATGEAEMQAEITALLGTDDAMNIAERLAYLADQPVRINSADEEEIGRLFFLTEFQVRVLADHVMKKGNIVSVFEIALLPGFDRATAMMMEPYISLDTPYMLSFPGRGTTTAVATVMFKGASSEEDSAGIRSLLRLRHSGKTFSYGLTAENDPGEPFSFSHQAGPDFLSAHLMYEGKSFISRVIAGDYSLRFGEGLVVNSNSWQGGWLSSPSFMAGRTVVSPYTSSEENNFFRGVTAVLGSITRGAVIFVSSNTIDGRVRYTEGDSSAYISNLVTGGLHNTISGKEARNRVTENIAGVHYTTGGDRLRAGVTAAVTLFSLPLRPDTTDGINLYKLSGDRLFNMGIDVKASFNKIVLFGEAGYSRPGSWATLAGLRALPSERITINFLARYLTPGYHAFHSAGVGAGSSMANETGIAGNIHFEAARHLFITAGADIYKHPWLSYRSSAPSTGTRTDIRAEYSPTESLTCRAGWSILQREYDITDDATGLPETEEVRRHQLSFLAALSPQSAVTLTSRAVWCRVPEKDEEGFLLCQDIAWSPARLPLRLWLRYSLFTTHGWDSRIYIYENDMLQTSAIPALYGDGSRAYLMAEWNITPKIMLRVKYAVTAKEEFQENAVRHEVRGQAKVVF